MDLFSPKFLLLLLSFTGCCAGEDVLPDGPVDANLGGNVTLTVLSKITSDDDVLWNYSDGTSEPVNIVTYRREKLLITDAFKNKCSFNSTNGYLTVHSLKTEDSGDYEINILTSTGTKTGGIKVRVLEPVSAVVIKSDLTEVFEHNSSVSLTCSAKGSFLKFTWFNKTTPISVDGVRLTLKEEQSSSKLTIRNVLRTDLVGPIYCEAKNALQQVKSSPFNLTVFYGPDSVTIKPTKPGQYIQSKSDFNLTCSSPSEPPATFTWYYNKDKIKVTGPVLTLKTIEEQGFGQKEGDYTCWAQNSKTMHYVVSSAVKFSVMEAISGTNITGPTATLIAGNSTANLSCQATAGKVMERIWRKDGNPLAASSRVVFSDDKSSVLITPVQKEDNGKYSCQLKNPVNEEEASYAMIVSYGPESVKVEGKKEIEVNDGVKLTCSFESIPLPNITWKLNDTVIKGKTAALLIIQNATYKDSGTYKCETYNVITGKKATADLFLSVKEEIYDGLSDGAIAGIVIACLVAVGALIGVIYYCRGKVPTESPY